MGERPQWQDSFSNEAETIPEDLQTPGNGLRAPKPPKRKERAVPGVSLRALIEDRNYPALAGLGLLGIGVLLIAENMLGLDFSLWGLMLLGIGGWIMTDAWQTYQQNRRTWTSVARNRLLAGGLVTLIALMGMISINWWSLLLLGAGGWLGYDSWQRYESQGRVLDETARRRGWVGVLIAALGFFGLFGLGSAWPLLLIAIGAAMLYRHQRG